MRELKCPRALLQWQDQGGQAWDSWRSCQPAIILIGILPKKAVCQGKRSLGKMLWGVPPRQKLWQTVKPRLYLYQEAAPPSLVGAAPAISHEFCQAQRAQRHFRTHQSSENTPVLHTVPSSFLQWWEMQIANGQKSQERESRASPCPVACRSS